VAYEFVVAPLPSGQWTPAQFGGILRNAVDPNNVLQSTVAVNGLTYSVRWTARVSFKKLYLPPAAAIDPLLTSTGATISGGYTPGTSAQLFNGTWPGTGTFAWVTTLPRPPQRTTWPYVLTLPPNTRMFAADLAAALQAALVNAVAGATATVVGGRVQIDTGDNAKTLWLPTYGELTDAAWRLANWPSEIVGYDAADPRAYNELLPLPAPPSAPARTILLGAFPAYIETVVQPLLQRQYNTGTDLAAALQLVIRETNPNATVTFDTSLGTLVIQSPPPWRLQFPTDPELRNRNWRAANWDPYPASSVIAYDTSNPRDLNAQLFFPSPSTFREFTLTGNIDMTPYREVYLASSLTNYRTLQSGTGAKDIQVRIPIDVDYGQVVAYRHLGPSDALSASDEHFRVLQFRFVDWAGRLVPIDQPVVIELVFLDSDPYSM